MSLVKWAHINFLWGLPVRNPEYVPVIPLADLAELVEGLMGNMASVPPEDRNGYKMGLKDLQRLLTHQLEAHGKGVDK